MSICRCASVTSFTLRSAQLPDSAAGAIASRSGADCQALFIVPAPGLIRRFRAGDDVVERVALDGLAAGGADQPADGAGASWPRACARRPCGRSSLPARCRRGRRRRTTAPVCATSTPVAIQNALTCGMLSSISRETACTRSVSVALGAGSFRIWLLSGWNASGMNAWNPPVSSCSARARSM